MKLSIIILAGNEAEMIKECLISASFADEIILVLANSSDNTKKIAKSLKIPLKVVETTDEYNKNFSKWRNLGYKAATGDWLLYLDADERITPELKSEILLTINSTNLVNYYAIPRANYYLGERVHFGGSYPDYVKRLYVKKHFSGYRGYLHEEPMVKGEMGYLKNDLLHYTHRNLNSMLQKTLVWTDLEAEALLKAAHPPVVWWRFPRMMLTKTWQRLIKEQMWRDGTVGWISVIFESFDTFIIYAKLWEKQVYDSKSRHL
ncbi:MAG TPA: glycosyltransferase family 2 protein [Candidatus Woesebacteria bacterium]|nr:glycosyltransferase family 2 protein [Candidatus Woesebacteria bacterium]